MKTYILSIAYVSIGLLVVPVFAFDPYVHVSRYTLKAVANAAPISNVDVIGAVQALKDVFQFTGFGICEKEVHEDAKDLHREVMTNDDKRRRITSTHLNFFLLQPHRARDSNRMSSANVF